MKNSIPVAVIVCIMIICSAFYIKYRKSNETAEAMTVFSQYVREYSSNMSFSDLAYKLQEKTTAEGIK